MAVLIISLQQGPRSLREELSHRLTFLLSQDSLEEQNRLYFKELVRVIERVGEPKLCRVDRKPRDVLRFQSKVCLPAQFPLLGASAVA